jgi:hypothetical protein
MLETMRVMDVSGTQVLFTVIYHHIIKPKRKSIILEEAPKILQKTSISIPKINLAKKRRHLVNLDSNQKPALGLRV